MRACVPFRAVNTLRVLVANREAICVWSTVSLLASRKHSHTLQRTHVPLVALHALTIALRTGLIRPGTFWARMTEDIISTSELRIKIGPVCTRFTRNRMNRRICWTRRTVSTYLAGTLPSLILISSDRATRRLIAPSRTYKVA